MNFWASWCGPCKDEAPVLERMWREGLVVLGVDAQDFKGDARSFMRKYGVTCTPSSTTVRGRPWAAGVTGFPETFCVDRRGRLVGEKIDGGIDVERNLERLERCVESRQAHDPLLVAAVLAALLVGAPSASAAERPNPA